MITAGCNHKNWVWATARKDSTLMRVMDKGGEVINTRSITFHMHEKVQSHEMTLEIDLIVEHSWPYHDT